MNLITIISILLLSVAFTLVFVMGLKSRGPWGSGWTFFTIVCLWLAAVSLWIPPAPLWFGAPIIDLFVTGLLISFVLSATSADSMTSSHAWPVDVSSNNARMDNGGNGELDMLNGSILSHQRMPLRTGGFFWMLLLCLSALIIVGAF